MLAMRMVLLAATQVPSREGLRLCRNPPSLFAPVGSLLTVCCLLLRTLLLPPMLLCDCWWDRCRMSICVGA